MTTIEIPIRELHARTGHFVRKAAENFRVVITDHGKPVAQIQPLSPPADGKTSRPKWKDRVLLPGYAAIMNKPVGGTDSAKIISEDRDRGSDW
jgi:prevent-host-death family protein